MEHSKRRLMTFAIVALAVLGISVLYRPRRTIASVYGDEVSKTLKEPERVELYRTVRKPPFSKEKDWPEPQSNELFAMGMRRTAGPLPVPSGWPAELVSQVEGFEASGYDPEGVKACGTPRPGVIVRFFRNGSYADLMLCFECNVLGVARPGQKHWERDQYFDPYRPEFVRLVKQALPDDPEIQGLEERL